jgi:putative two-component system response regulator
VFALALAQVAAARAREPAGRPARVAALSRSLATTAARLPAFRNFIDDSFIAGLAAVAPLHDVGKVAVPDHVLFKPGPLDPEERAVMETHAALGAGLIREAAGPVLPPNLLRMAVEVARHHHERYDGTGYPDGLCGSAIPLAARLVAVAAEYESLRTATPARPALDHAAAVEVISRGSPGRFDPTILEAFERCSGEWEKQAREGG